MSVSDYAKQLDEAYDKAELNCFDESALEGVDPAGG